MIVIAEWEVEDTAQYFRHRIVLKDEHGTVVKTSHFCSYRGIATLDYGGVMYRAATENYDGVLPVNCVFTVQAPPKCSSCKGSGKQNAGICQLCLGTGRQVLKSAIEQTNDVGVAYGPHGTPGHRCTPFCEDYGPPRCEHGTEHCTGKGEKHACDVRTAR